MAMTASGAKGPGYLKHISFKLMLTRSFCSFDKQGRLGLKMMEAFMAKMKLASQALPATISQRTLYEP